jgi:hypothetical protein
MNRLRGLTRPDRDYLLIAWERGLEVRLGEWFEKLGTGRPLDAARTSRGAHQLPQRWCLYSFRTIRNRIG